MYILLLVWRFIYVYKDFQVQYLPQQRFNNHLHSGGLIDRSIREESDLRECPISEGLENCFFYAKSRIEKPFINKVEENRIGIKGQKFLLKTDIQNSR